MEVNDNDSVDESTESETVIAQFKTEDGESTGPPLQIPLNASSSQLETLINHLLKNVWFARVDAHTRTPFTYATSLRSMVFF